MKKILCIILALMMLFLFASCGGNGEEISDGTTAPTEIQREKDGLFSSFTAKSVDGKKIDESIFKGKKVTMINIWGTFCGPCIKEMPDLQRLSEDYADKDFQIIGIVCDVQNDGGILEELSIKKVKDILDDTGVKYLNLLPSDDLMNIRLKELYSVPETIFVDEDGNTLGEAIIGSKDYERWAEIIDDMLEKAE